MEDLIKHKAKVGNISTTMMQLATADETDIDLKPIPHLLEDIQKVSAKHDELQGWADKFGLSEAKQRKRKPKA